MAAVFALVGVSGVLQSSMLLLLLLIPSIWIGVPLAVKRLHDRNKSAWWLVIFYVLPGILQGIEGFARDAGIILLIASWALSIFLRWNWVGPRSDAFITDRKALARPVLAG